jgi:hypothetical protein
MPTYVMYDVIPERRWHPTKPWYMIVKVPMGTPHLAPDVDAIHRIVQAKGLGIPIVIMLGEPSERPQLLGPIEKVEHARANLDLIATHTWAPLRID